MDETETPQLDSNETTSKKRFTLPKEKHIKTRLHATREALSELQDTHPEVVGMTLYGSMVSGRAKETSDIDGFVFLEEKQAKDRLSEKDWEWAKAKKEEDKRNRPEWSTAEGTSELDLAATHKYKPLIDSVLKKKSLTDDQIEHMRVRVVGRQTIQDELVSAVDEEEKLSKYALEMATWDKMLNKLPIEKWPNLGDRPQYPDIKMVDWKIPAMFHLEVGRGLNHYRKQVVNHLKQNGKAGERVWKSIITRTADMERHLRGSEHPDQYPQTLEKAADYYHLQSEQKQKEE